MDSDLNIPVVMTFAGNDPTGGAGLQADIETLASVGCHAAPVVTVLTIQDTQDVKGFATVDTALLIQQARAVLEDMPVAAFKLGMLGGVEIIEAVHSILMDYPDIPVIFDPVIASGAGTSLVDDNMLDAMANMLFPMTTILTPNTLEAKSLAPEADTIDACAQVLQQLGCEYVLVTGTHDGTKDVVNHLYSDHRLLESYRWSRLPYSYHGSGCTLSSAIAGLMAHGHEPYTAVYEAQEYTWESLQYGYRVGMGQHIPNRLFWASVTEEDTE